MRTNEQHGPISCVPIELLCSNNNINTVIYRAKPTNRPRRRVTGNLEEEEEEFIMVALCNRETIYIFMLWFVLLLFFPRLISAAADWMSAILPHMVWPQCEFKMQV